MQSPLGRDVPGLSASTITRLKSTWEANYRDWSKHSLGRKHYLYVWADGVAFNMRLEEDRQCILVLMGATADGKKEMIAISDGYRASVQSWKELLLDVNARGLVADPNLATGDGALGLWKAVRGVWPATREQRCCVNKTGNVLDKFHQTLAVGSREETARHLDARHARSRPRGLRAVLGNLPGEVPVGKRVLDE